MAASGDTLDSIYQAIYDAGFNLMERLQSNEPLTSGEYVEAAATVRNLLLLSSLRPGAALFPVAMKEADPLQ